MGQVPVVSERQFDGAEKVIREAVGRGLVLAGACWAQTADDGRAYLYLVGPDVLNTGIGPVARKVREVIDALDTRKAWGHWHERVDGFDVMVVAPNSPIGQALAREYEQYRGENPTVLHNWIGTVPVQGAALVYPPAMFTQALPVAG